MEPTRNSALVDLVDRILVKGVILHADLVISISGVPLIGVNLRAAIAGMTTMLDYGMMEAWDEKIRKYAVENSEEEVPLNNGEEVVLKRYASLCYGDTPHDNVWRHGSLYLTNTRLFLLRKKPMKILFEVALNKIKGLTVDMKKYLNGKEEMLLVLFETDQLNMNVAMLRTEGIGELKRRLEESQKIVKATPSAY